MKPRLLDLFSGAGGSAMGYSRAGFEVVGVDIERARRANYPFEFICADALKLMETGLRTGMICGVWRLADFDVIHASPPCQAYSVATADKSLHPDLVAEVRDQLVAVGLPYVIENVQGAPLIDPVRLCGSSFGLPLHRHRLFESNFPLMVPPCAHGQLARKFDVYEHGRWYKGATVKVYGSGGGKANAHWADAMGIDWMTHAEMAEAIPPAFTEMLGLQLIQQLRRAAA